MIGRRKNKENSSRDKAQNSQGQRVYTYYTASKSQIDQFERSNKNRESKQSTISKSGYLAAKIAFSLAIVAILIFMVTLSSTPAIKFIGEKDYNSANLYVEKISNMLSSDKRNIFKFSLQTDTLTTSIINEFPEAESVSVYASPLGREPVVKITTNQPFAVLIQQGSPSYLVDSNGKTVVDINNTNIDTSTLPTLTNQSGLSYNLGDQVFKPDEMQALNSLNYQLTNDNTKAAYIIPEIPRELRLSRGTYYVKFSLDDSSGADSQQQFGALKSIENSIKEQGAIKPKEYIDVRLGDKVYVK